MSEAPRPSRQRVRVQVVEPPPEPIPAAELLSGKPYRYPKTPNSYYERSNRTLSELVRALGSEKSLDSQDQSLLGEARRLGSAAVVLVRITRWQTESGRRERRNFLVVDGATVFFELKPPPGYIPGEPSRGGDSGPSAGQ